MRERLIYNNIKKNMEIGFSFSSACSAVLDDCCQTKHEKYNMKKSISNIFKIVDVPNAENKKVSLSTFKAVMEMIDSDSVPCAFRA